MTRTTLHPLLPTALAFAAIVVGAGLLAGLPGLLAGLGVLAGMLGLSTGIIGLADLTARLSGRP